MDVVNFELTTDLTPISSTQIQANFDEVKAWLTDSLKPYESLVFTEDSIKDARRTRADLRKISTAIDDQRKAVKKEWMRPYEAYEAKCKELTGIVGEAVSNIDGQIKEMENAEKEAKRQRLSDFFDEHSYDVADFITFNDIFDSKWLNATFSEVDAANSIAAQIEDIKEGLETIRSMNSPYEAAMLSEYGKTHNLSKALAEGRRLEAIQKAEEERKAREAEQSASVPAEPEAPTETPVERPAPIQPSVRPVVDDAPTEKTYSYEFTFLNMTRVQSFALKACLEENGIKYKVKKI